jgi:diacylglycerol kinase
MKYIKSFAYAISGFSYAFRTQSNMRFHVFAAVVALLMSLLFRINIIEWCIIVLCIGSVFTAELINTSIEVSIDLTSPGYNKQAGNAKDLSAAAVLVVCIASAIIGLIIFVPYIVNLFL